MDDWNWQQLMDAARRAAAHRGERVQVLAGQSRRGRWVWSIACAQDCSVCRALRGWRP